jgi:hypothetical protein
MNKKKLSFVVVGLMMLFSVLACGFSASTANLQNVRMARDYDGTDPTNVFTPEETFYCVANLQNAPADSVVRADWYAVAIEGEEPNFFIDSAEVTSGDGSLHFELSNPGPWPVGTYKVELYLNDELKETLEFTVQ